MIRLNSGTEMTSYRRKDYSNANEEEMEPLTFLAKKPQIQVS